MRRSRAATRRPRPAQHRDAVDWLTTSRNPAQTEQDSSSAARRLLATSFVLTLLLFGCLGRLWWLTQGSPVVTVIDQLTVPIALLSLLLLLLSVLGWDRVNQHNLADLRNQSLQKLTEIQNAGEARLTALMSSTSELVLVLDHAGRITYSSSASYTLLGATAQYLRGRRVDCFLTDESSEKLLKALPGLGVGMNLRLELQATHIDGHTMQVELAIGSHVLDNSDRGYVVSVRDISQLSQFAAKLATQALLDPLTSLPNRRHFLTQLAKEVRENGSGTTVAVINLVDFKAVNAVHGHEIGDEVLTEVGRRLKAIGGDLIPIARVGGDEFAVLLFAEYGSEVQSVTDVLLAELGRPIAVAGTSLVLRVAIGVAQAADGTLADDLLQQADTAMRAGEQGVTHYEPSVHHRVLDRLALRQELEQAIRGRELQLHYQTLVDLNTGVVRGLEALVRWEHSERGFVPPDEFVTLAEQSGLMLEMGDWILREACGAGARLQVPGQPIRMSVNVSAIQLARPDFVIDLLGVLEDVGLDPRLLLLEITETAVVVGLDAVIPRLEALRSIGVHVAMDDFGTGYSSLSYLTRLPLDELKIDRSFVDRLPGDPQTELVVRGMLEMSSELGLYTVGEGIENEEQADWLRQAGVQLGQGYLYSRPMPEHRVAEVVSRLVRVPAQARRALA